jgi:hypothetical protein
VRLVASLAAIALIAAALFGGAWFRIDLGQPIVPFVAGFRVDLHALSVCDPQGACEAMSIARLDGAYPALAVIAFWTGAATIVLVALQAVANRRVLAYVGAVVAGAAGAAAALAAYVLPPSPSEFGDGAAHVEPTLAPVAMLLGAAVAVLALRPREAAPPPSGSAQGTDEPQHELHAQPRRMVAVEPPPKRPTSDT